MPRDPGVYSLTQFQRIAWSHGLWHRRWSTRSRLSHSTHVRPARRPTGRDGRSA